MAALCNFCYNVLVMLFVAVVVDVFVVAVRLLLFVVVGCWLLVAVC